MRPSPSLCEVDLLGRLDLLADPVYLARDGVRVRVRLRLRLRVRVRVRVRLRPSG